MITTHPESLFPALWLLRFNLKSCPACYPVKKYAHSRPQIRDAVPLKNFIEKGKIENSKSDWMPDQVRHDANPSGLSLIPAPELDQRYPGGRAWTLALLVVGLAIGCLNAWHWVSREDKAMRDLTKYLS